MRSPLSTLLLSLVMAASSAFGATLDLPEAWKLDTGTFLESAAVAGDINDDGLDEIVAAGREELIAVDGAGKELWRWRTKGRFMTYPAVLQRPGQPALLFAADTAGQFSCVDGTGKEVWHAGLKGPSSWSATAVADLTNDGQMEVVQTDEAGTVWALDAASGKLLWQSAVQGIPVSPAVGDLDGDGQCEVAVATGAGGLFVLKSNGDPAWQYSLGGASQSWGTSAPVIFQASGGQVRVAAASSANVLHCLDATGKELWNAPTRGAAASTLSVGDLDMDGRTDLFCVTQLGVIHRFDEDGKRLWEIDMQGRCLAPGAIIDVNDDGQKEYVLCTQTGHLMLLDSQGQFLFERQFDHRTINVTPAFGRFTREPGRLQMAITGGEAGFLYCLDTPAPAEAASDWSAYRRDAHNTGAWTARKPAGTAPMIPEDLAEDRLLTGRDVRFRIATLAPETRILSAEAACTGPDGTRQAARTRVVAGRGELRLPLQFVAAGTYRFTWTLADDHGKPLCSGGRELAVAPFANDRALAERAVDALNAAADEVAATLPHSASALRREKRSLEDRRAEAASLQEQAIAGDKGALRAALDAGAALVAAAERGQRLAELTRRAAALGAGTSLVAFEGRTWESREVDRQLPADVVQPLRLERRIVPGEHDPVPLMLLNITDEPIQARLRIESPGEGFAVRVLHSVPVPASLGDVSWDPLPELDASGIVSVPSLGCQELWLDVDAVNAAPGTASLSVRFQAINGASVIDAPKTPMSVAPPETNVTVAYNVLPFRMAPSGAFRLCMWSAPEGGMWEDLLAHGNNVFLAPLPEAKYGAGGSITGSDFSKLDAVLDHFRGHDVVVLLMGLPALRGAAGEEGRRRDLRVYLDELMAHMAAAGIDREHFALYPFDEPGGLGWNVVNQLVAFGNDVRAVNPKVQIYMDGGMELPMFEAMAPVIDIWTPGIYMLPEKSDVMKGVHETGKTLWSYNCAYAYSRPAGPNLKNINIVAEYRNAALFALRYGATGIGFWCYNQGGDPWTRVDMEYMAVYPGDAGPVVSRRWEAIRESIEDARIYLALQQRLADPSTPLSDELRARLRRLGDELLPAMIDPSFEEMRMGLARYVLDNRNNDAAVQAFRDELLDCIEALKL